MESSSTSVIAAADKDDDPVDNIVPWTDARIRWVEDYVDDDKNKDNRVDKDGDDDDDDDDSVAFLDPFADLNPMETFQFDFATCHNNNNAIHVTIHGYKRDADAVWESTGLTLWKAAEYLCTYMAAAQKNQELLDQKSVLELGAGLGLCGVTAHLLGAARVCITDGDSAALQHLRQNVAANVTSSSSSSETSTTVTVRQLLWGRETTHTFIQQQAATQNEKSSLYQVIIASDIVYAAVIVEPLWETVSMLLEKTADAVFVMAYARRDVPVTIQDVIQAGNHAGFDAKLMAEDPSGIWVYEFRWKEEYLLEAPPA